jgi:predicted phosphoribosyltransferase
VKIFANRVAAGRALGARLAKLGIRGDVVVLALPRGGVPVACEVAARLRAAVDVLIVRKIGAPSNPELAVGAVAAGGVTIYNDDVLAGLDLLREDVEPIRRRELLELERREVAYRRRAGAPDVAGRTVVIVDDGMATGATMYAAAQAVRFLGPARIVVAVPTAARDAAERLEAVADSVVALEMPEPYCGVGAWYEDFEQLSDEQVGAALAATAEPRAGAAQRSS